MTLVAVFPSPAKRCVDYMERYQTAFPIIADPGEEIFGLYCSQTSCLNQAGPLS